MWDIDPVDLWAMVAIAIGYSLPFLALILEAELHELKRKADEKEARKAALRRLVIGY